MKLKGPVYLQWLDPFESCDGWTPFEEFSPRMAVCESVGWIIKETPETITIVAHVSDREEKSKFVDGDITVKKAQITKRRTLK